MKKFIPKLLLILGVLGIFTLIIGCSKTTSEKNTTTKKAVAVKQVTKTLTTKKFSDLKIISQNADVIIEAGKSYKVIYQGKSNTVPIVKESKNKLIVDQVKTQHALGLMRVPQIIVTIPKKSKLSKLIVNNSSADVRISNLYLKQGIISSDSGDITISDSKLTNGMNLKATTGNIKVKNTKFTGYKLTTTDGQIQVKNYSTSSSYVKNAKSKNVLVAKSGSRDIWVK